MLIDNKRELETGQHYKTVFQYLEEKLIADGEFNFVTGYFTITAIAALLNKFPKQKNYKIILGDLFSVKPSRKNIIDVINKNHKVVDVFNIKESCEKAVEFLKQENVEVKTVDKNFCHAKAYIYKNPNPKNSEQNFYIVGSSNFTDAGLGVRLSANIELNKLIGGRDSGFAVAQNWFELLWNADSTKSTVEDEHNQTIDCKTFLIDLISEFFEKYSVEQLYYKTLYELFRNDLDRFNLEISSKDFTHLRDTVVFNKLFTFQQKGVLSLIRMIQKYDGAILADAVGLGKTWSALAVMKYYELQGYKVVVICPRKLSNNWTRYKKDNHSVFEADKMEFYTLPQSQLFDNGTSIESMPISNFKKFQKLFIVIDESHNLRNDASNRYKFLISQFYSQLGNKDVKSLLLSATPINNKLIDVRNQFKIIAKGNDAGFADTPGLEIKSLETKFKKAQEYFNKWQFQQDRKISELRAVIPDEITLLIDSMVVARTRHLIKKYLNENIHFPHVAPPESIPGNVIEMGAIKTIDDVLGVIQRINMTAYKPAFYMKAVKAKDATEDDRSRQKALAKLMYILLVKRMESSWFAFHQTANSIYNYHLTVLKLVSEYRKDKNKGAPEVPTEDQEQMEIDEILEDMNIEGEEIGKKRVIHLSQIIQLDKFEADLRKDAENLKFLVDNLAILANSIKKEDTSKKPTKSADRKLEQLLEVINKKRKESPKRKIIIFSVFRDTSKYLYEQLKSRGFENLGLVTGSENQCTHQNIKRKNETDFEPILERFAPETKLFREKDWDFLYDTHKLDKPKNYKQWLAIIKKYDKDTQAIIDQPVDILIATDCLSEGQNLQDSDCLINYDIHWNPVRLIQRFGRIDRIGSNFKTIYGINFWPAKDIDDYLRLKGRVESRMAAGSLIGTETQTISSNYEDILDDKDKIISKQAEKLFMQLKTSWEDIEDKAESVGFNDLSYEQFRQELFELMGSKREELERIPNGVYTGFNSNPETKLHAFGPGIMGLIGYPRKPENNSEHQYSHLELFYISKDKKFQILNNMEVLFNLRENKMEKRFVPDSIDQPSVATIEELKGLIEEWMKRKFAQEDFDALAKLADGGKIEKINKDEIPAERYTLENYDLITWFVVSKNKNF